MAEEKKPPSTSGSNSNIKTTEYLLFLLAGLVLIGAIITALLNLVGGLGFGSLSEIWDSMTSYFFRHIWPTWKFVAAIISALAFVGIIYNEWQLRAINIEEKKIYDPSIPNQVADENPASEPKNEKWKNIIKYANSNNLSDWQSAIIEADIMLEKLLRTKGYVGDSLGDMLKSAKKNDFVTLDEAWEAHKVRNAIVHSGGDFKLTERETKRTIALFEKVFKELKML
ncbi:MAG: hypothetical protein AAB586_00135 [Patescibacteria group bacterium]